MILAALLEVAKERGLLGPGPVDAHLAHAAGFLSAIGGRADGGGANRILDMGSGAGLPGLVLAQHWPDATTVLLDSSQRRTQFLREAVEGLGLPNVVVLEDRAERIGRLPRWRAWADVVVARSFGAPGVTAECGAPLLGLGGRLVVSEPPEADEALRWPSGQLRSLGLQWEALVSAGSAHVAVLRQVELCPERYPRRTGVPAKRPLF